MSKKPKTQKIVKKEKVEPIIGEAIATDDLVEDIQEAPEAPDEIRTQAFIEEITPEEKMEIYFSSKKGRIKLKQLPPNGTFIDVKTRERYMSETAVKELFAPVA